MFVTQLTKHDWYRIYKYLWKAQISPNRFRIFAKFGMVLFSFVSYISLSTYNSACFTLITISYPVHCFYLLFRSFFIAIIVFLLTFYHPLLFGKN